MAGSLEPSILTIFGITGDLSKRKLLPALYHLAEDGLLPKNMRIVGISRRDVDVSQLISKIEAAVEASGETCKKDTLAWLKNALSTVKMDLSKPKEYQRLKTELNKIEDEVGMCLHRLFYLSVPANAFKPVVEQLGSQKLNTGCQHSTTESRLLIEKPFGTDTKSAEELIEVLRGSFEERQIYRIDHYLAKETVQNILKFRFENPLFSMNWDKDHISHVIITAAESIGIEGRVGFYENVGAMRDLIQNHLLQILALVTMDEPKDITAKSMHDEKEKLYAAIQPPTEEQMSTHTVRGQYATYKKEVEKNTSKTETYAAVRLNIKNDRWDGVPMLIRTGKSMAEKVTEVTVLFKDPTKKSHTNTLTIRVQPHEGIVLDLRIKKPGFDAHKTAHTQMSFCYAKGGEEATSSGIDATHPDAYERVLMGAMTGEKTLFATSDEILHSWRVTDPILDAWARNKSPLEIYKQGSWGPTSADTLAKKAGTTWLSSSNYVCAVHPSK